MSQSLYDFCVENRRTELLEEWDRPKNSDLSPKDISYGSRKPVWWRCAKGHVWQAMVYTRSTAASVCPVCSNKRVVAGENDLQSLRPEIAAQWHPTLNGTLTPEMVTVGSTHTVWWQCADGHVWKTAVYTRTSDRKCGCPVCAGAVKRRRYGQDRQIPAAKL